VKESLKNTKYGGPYLRANNCNSVAVVAKEKKGFRTAQKPANRESLLQYQLHTFSCSHFSLVQGFMMCYRTRWSDLVVAIKVWTFLPLTASTVDVGNRTHTPNIRRVEKEPVVKKVKLTHVPLFNKGI
jgi:hypothetical protein